MTVKITLKDDPGRTVVFQDDDTHCYTAQEFHDGRVAVTQGRKGSSDEGVVVAEFAMSDIASMTNGWPSDNGPLD